MPLQRNTVHKIPVTLSLLPIKHLPENVMDTGQLVLA